MKLTNLSYENYKTFSQRETIEIRPLTILIGRNSSGKSVIARLPLLLGTLLANLDNSLELDLNGLDFGLSFSDLVHNRIPHGKVGMGATVSFNGQTLTYEIDLQYFDEYRLVQISRFLVTTDTLKMTLLWQGRNPLEETNSQIYQWVETQQLCQVSFRGFWPWEIRPLPTDPPEACHQVQSVLQELNLLIAKGFKNVVYLGPFREEPQRFYRFPNTSVHNVGFRGRKTAELLGDDVLRHGGKVMAAVSRWFCEHLGGSPLDLIAQGEVFSLVLRKPDNPSVEINIVDVGAGISQVLPIVVQRQCELVRDKLSTFEIVEQPELHLHPGAHGEVADLYIEAIRKSQTHFLIETHSENFLLRVRRKIAEGLIDANQTICYWVNDNPKPGELFLQPIYIDSLGDVDQWPNGVFSEDFEEVRQIRKAQQKNQQKPEVIEP
jgi:hypothetical protein